MPSNPYNPNILDARRQQYELEVDNGIKFKLLILLLIATSLLILLIGSNSTIITFQRTLWYLFWSYMVFLPAISLSFGALLGFIPYKNAPYALRFARLSLLWMIVLTILNPLCFAFLLLLKEMAPMAN